MARREVVGARGGGGGGGEKHTGREWRVCGYVSHDVQILKLCHTSAVRFSLSVTLIQGLEVAQAVTDWEVSCRNWRASWTASGRACSSDTRKNIASPTSRS